MRADLLHVVTCYFNPIRWESRLRLYQEFEQRMLDSGVQLTTVECALGERPFETVGTNPNVNYVPIRAKTVLWNKESLLRIGIQRLPDPDWKYVCWSDSDIKFRQPTWAADTVHALQQYDVIQPWSDAYDLGPNDSHLAVYKSFLHQWWNGKSVVYGVDPANTHFEKRVHGVENSIIHPAQRAQMAATGITTNALPQTSLIRQHQERHGVHHDPHKTDPHKHHKKHHHHPHGCKCDDCCCCPYPPPPPYYGMVSQRQAARMPWWKRDGGPHEYPHTGYAWAATRRVIDGVGGLFDLAAMGAGDYHMALALVGHADRSMPGKVSDSYKKHLMSWQERALEYVNFNMGYLQGTIEHSFHGAKGNRRYIDRWQIILEHEFDPDVDILRNAHGVFELRCTKPKLRHDLDVYFRQRNEDANIII